MSTDFKYSIQDAKQIASQMFDFLGPQNDMLGEEEVMKILNIAYQGVKTDEDVKYDDIVSYINFHGGSQ